MQVWKTQVPNCMGGKRKYGKRKYKSAGVENISTETGRAILTQTWQKNITRQGSYWIQPTTTPYGTDGSSVGGRRHRLVTVLQPSYHPVCSSYQALSRSYLLQGLPILEHRQPARWSSSRLGSDSLWSPTASLRVVTVDQVFTVENQRNLCGGFWIQRHSRLEMQLVRVLHLLT